MASVADSSKTIFIADDSASQRRYLEILLSLDGHQVTTSNSSEALEAARQAKPDLIILAINVNDTDGLEICRDMKRWNDLAGVPIILITSLENEQTWKLAEDAQADALITKPLMGKNIRGLIGGILERKAPAHTFAVY